MSGFVRRIALMQNGRIMSVNTPKNIVAAYPVPLYAVKTGNIYKLLSDMRNSEEVESCFAFGEYLHITLRNDNTGGVTALKNSIAAQGHTDIEVKTLAPTIEDSFIRLMNENKNQSSIAKG